VFRARIALTRAAQGFCNRETGTSGPPFLTDPNERD
jgi:hypothetical protein